MKKARSLSTQRRHSIREAYRARGHGNHNLWLVYSVKTDRDWLLPSDRQLIHWLCNLEINANVRTFDLAPEPVFSHDAKEARATELDAVVYYTDGRVEWHEVKASDEVDSHRDQLQAQAAAAHHHNAIYRLFSDKDLEPQAVLATRWLSCLAHAALLCDRDCVPTVIALQSLLLTRTRGTVGEILSELSEHDPATVLGVLIRTSIREGLLLDLTPGPLGTATRWERQNV